MSSAGRRNDGWIDVASPDDGWIDVAPPKPAARTEDTSGGLINSYARQNEADVAEAHSSGFDDPSPRLEFLGKSAVSGVRQGAAAGLGIAADVYNALFGLSEHEADVLSGPKGDGSFTKEDAANFTKYSPGNIMERAARDQYKAADDITSTLSPGARKFADKEYMTTDPEKSAFLSPTKLVGDVLQSLPSTALLALTARFGGTAAADARAEALAAGLSEQAANKAAVEAATKVVTRAGAAGEGVLGYEQQYSQTRQQVIAMPQEKIEKSPEYQRMIQDGYDPDAARKMLANQAGNLAGLTSAIVDAGTNLASGPILGKVIGEGGGLINRTGKALATEATQEAVQSGGEQLGSNVAIQETADPSQKLSEGVGEATLQGAAVGGLTGGALGAAVGEHGLGHTPAPEEPSTAETFTSVPETQIDKEPVAVLPPQPEAKVAVADVLNAPDIDTAIDAATKAAAMTPEGGNGPSLTESIAEGKRLLDEAAPNPQLEKLGKLFQGLNDGEVEKVDDLTYNYKPAGKDETIPLRVWDPASAPKTETTISPEIAKAQRDYYTGEHGIDVVYFENDDRIPFDGVVDPTQPNTLFLSNDPSRNALQIGAHEFTHILEDVKGPDGESLADILHQQISSGITDLGWDYAKTRFSGTAPQRSLFGEEGPEGDAAHAQAVTAHFIKELAGDIGGEAPKFDTFIPKVMTEVENRYGKSVAADMFQKFMDGIRSAMETIKAFFQDGTNTVSQHLVTNLDQIHTTLAKMYAAKYGEALADPETSPELSKPFERTGPAPKPGYEEAKVRATNLKRWLDELDTKRREDAKTDPDTVLLQAQEHDILRKVGGVEERLTKAAAQRLAFIREKIDARLNPKGDNYDMARVREAMVKEHQKMADATAVSKKYSPKQSDKFSYDNPGVTRGEEGKQWLANKVADAAAADAKGFSVYGPITASSKQHLDVPISVLEKIPGARKEVRAAGDDQFDRLLAKAKTEGFKPPPILVGVNYRGEPYIVEGNTRVAVGKALGAKTVPTEVRYYAGGETKARAGFTPEDFAKFSAAAPKFSPKTALKLKEPPDKTKEMLDTVPGLKRVFANLTPEEHKAITSRTAEKLVKLFENLPSGEETAAVAFSGRAKRGWYQHSARALVEVFGQEDAPRFVALLAALSPQTSVESNLENALSTWVNWQKAGRPTDPKVIGQILGRSVQGSGTEASVLDAWRGNAVRSLVHPDPGHVNFMLSGAKVNSFAQNLREYVNEVTNDAWMATFAGLEGEALASARKPNKIDDIGKSFGFKSPGYLALSAMVRDAAKVLTRKTGQQWTPAEIQETVWSWAKTLYERRDRAGEDRTTQQILKAADMTHEDVNSTPDFAKLLVTGIYRKILEGGDYAKALEKLESAADGGGRITGPAVSVTSAEGSGFAQSAFERHLQRAAARLERIRTDRLTAKGVDPRDLAKQAREGEIRANLSAATGSIPGIRQLVEAADAGDDSAGRLVNLIAHESLERLVASIPGVKLDITHNGGLYGGALEPSLGVKVAFEERARGTVLAALAKFADNFNQEQIHVRQETIDNPGRVYTDGSYATPVYTFDLTQPLSRPEIEKVIADSGLFGLNFNDRNMEAYFVGDPRDANARLEFDAAIERARESLGDRADGFRRSTARLWAYGKGEGAALGYDAIGGDIPASTVQHTEVPRAIAERQLGYEIEPSTAAPVVTPEQAQLQRRIADHYDQLPDNDLANPNVAKAYTELTKELDKQFDSLPVKVDIWDHAKGEPYKSSADMRRDILDNNHMWIFATSPESFGPPGADFTGHPLLEPTGKKSNNGHPMLVNDELRAVHDYYAHMMTASDFGPRGEEAAWRNHVATIDNPWARWALTSETRGQNSWVNFGAHVEEGSKLRDRPFARQKAALLPLSDTLTGSDNLDLPMLEFMRTLPQDQQNGSLPQGADDPFADFSPRVTPEMREELIKKNPDFLSIFRRPGEKVPNTEPVPAAPKKKAQGRQPLPMNKDRVFKTNALKIADEHADEVRALETKAFEDAAAKLKATTVEPPAEVEPAPIEPPPRRRSLQSIEGTGRERERAINGEIYNVGEEQPQLDRAASLVERDRAKAIRIAMRQEASIPNVHPEFVYMAVEQMAIRENDYALQEKLSHSIIAKEATDMGQRIAAWRNRAEISPVEDMRRIREAREARLAKTGESAEQLVEKAIKSSRRLAVSNKGPSLNEMIKNLICKT